MNTRLMSGLWRFMLSIPPFLWEKQIAKGKERLRSNVRFMTEEHRAVHHCIVRELPKVGTPISPEFIADKLSIPLDTVESIFHDLAEHMTFICRNSEGMAAWAYPVTAEKTPHHVAFSTGEQIYAA